MLLDVLELLRDFVVLLIALLLKDHEVCQEVLLLPLVELLPEVSDLEVFAESVDCQVILTNEEETLHLLVIELLLPVHELDVQSFFEDVDQTLCELNEVLVVPLDIVGEHVVHIVELLVLHLELNLLLLVLEVATRGIEGLLNVPNEIVLLFLRLSV